MTKLGVDHILTILTVEQDTELLSNLATDILSNVTIEVVQTNRFTEVQPAHDFNHLIVVVELLLLLLEIENYISSEIIAFECDLSFVDVDARVDCELSEVEISRIIAPRYGPLNRVDRCGAINGDKIFTCSDGSKDL